MKAKETLQSKEKKQKETLVETNVKHEMSDSEGRSRTSLKWGGYRNTATI